MPEAVPEPQDMVREQMAQAWGMMLSQLTAAGASREDLVEVTMMTAHGILETTRNALWGTPEERTAIQAQGADTVAPEEAEIASAINGVISSMDGWLMNL